MAIPNWSDPSLANLLGLDPPRLTAIINVSTEAAARMRSLNAQVDGAASTIAADMAAVPGKILEGRLTTWHQDCQVITAKFDELTDRTQQMMLSLQRGDAEATDRARS